MNYWLVTTEHLKDRLWFKEECDFKVGMNHVAVVSTMFPVTIYSFILMSNHVHFIVGGCEGDVYGFINEYKRKYSQYFNLKYHSKELLRRNRIDIKSIFLGDESFERAVAYVQMNCVAANICLSPITYSWGTGNLFFSQEKQESVLLGSMDKRAQKSLIHSKRLLPTNYILNKRGYIDPSSYVDVEFVESVFRTPKRMNYFLNNSSKALKNTIAPTFNDQLISSAIKNLCASLYRKTDFKELDSQQAANLFKQIRYRFSADVHQIARVTGASLEFIEKSIDTF